MASSNVFVVQELDILTQTILEHTAYTVGCKCCSGNGITLYGRVGYFAFLYNFKRLL